MGRFARRLALFVAPIAVYVVAVIVVDPFDRFGLSQAIPRTAKAIVSHASNQALWAVVQVDRDTLPNILLGDSRMVRLDVEEIRRVSGLPFANLAMDGASASDIADLFWRATEQHPRRDVVINLSLDKFNRGMNRDVVRGAERVESNPMLYVWNRDVLKSTMKLVSLRLSGRPPMPPQLGMTRDEFWEYELNYGQRRNLQGFQFDTTALAEFARIAQYCKDHSIRLRFVVLPVHADVHRRIKEFGLEEEWKDLPNKLRVMAETINLDVEGPLTADRESFDDPLHMRMSAVRLVIESIFRT